MNEGLNTISEHAFKGCTGLTSIDIPYSVSEIKENAFSGCTNIISATLNNSCVLKNFASVFPNYSILNTVILGEGVETIPDNAFKGCSKLNSITIGENVVAIEESAFSDCIELKTVSIPSKVKKIQRLAFSNCKELKEVVIEGNLDYVGERAFSDCAKLSKFIYKGTKEPGHDKDVFSNCQELDEVSVPKNYEGDNFCGFKIDLKNIHKFSKEDLATILSIAGSLCTIATFLFGMRCCCPTFWNRFVDTFCCGHCRVPIDELTTDVHDQSSSVNNPLLDNIDA